MKKYRFSFDERAAIWTAWKHKCAYTGEKIEFMNLEIDHILPETLLSHPNEFATLRHRLQLPAEFSINSFWNWIPVQRLANRRKGRRPLSDTTSLFFLELARRRYEDVVREHSRLQQVERSQSHLIEIANLVERGLLSHDEVRDFLRNATTPAGHASNEPLVICLGVGSDVFRDAVFYATTCDDLENALFKTLRSRVPGLIIQTESDRSGETLSVRFAIWDVSLEVILRATPAPWELLEFATFSEIYPNDSPDAFYEEAVGTS